MMHDRHSAGWHRSEIGLSQNAPSRIRSKLHAVAQAIAKRDRDAGRTSEALAMFHALPKLPRGRRLRGR